MDEENKDMIKNLIGAVIVKNKEIEIFFLHIIKIMLLHKDPFPHS